MNISVLIEKLQKLQEQGVKNVLVVVHSSDLNHDYYDNEPVDVIEEVDYEQEKCVVLKPW